MESEMAREFFLNVLGFREHEECVALALEMDIRGTGPTFKDALHNLFELVSMQISFAYFKKQPEMIWRPAEPVWFSLYAQVRAESMRDLLDEEEESPDYVASCMQVPSAHVIASLKDQFQVAHA